MTDDEDMTAAIEFVANDTNDFDMAEFMERWPKKPATQLMVLGMLIARSSREIRKLTIGHSRLWVVALTAVGVGSLSLFLHLQMSPVEAFGGALASVAGSLLLKALTK